jgi:transcriptional regulator with XRE-family HTH domain
VGRRRLSDEDLKFRAEVSAEFSRAIQDRGLNQSEAANQLGVTRQALSQYLLRKSTPQSPILARACTEWGLRLRYQGKAFASPKAGPEKTRTKSAPDGLQLDLFDQPQRVENDQLVVILERSAKATLQVTIKMKRADLTMKARKGAKARAR